jgi:hypothetical protein
VSVIKCKGSKARSLLANRPTTWAGVDFKPVPLQEGEDTFIEVYSFYFF